MEFYIIIIIILFLFLVVFILCDLYKPAEYMYFANFTIAQMKKINQIKTKNMDFNKNIIINLKLHFKNKLPDRATYENENIGTFTISKRKKMFYIEEIFNFSKKIEQKKTKHNYYVGNNKTFIEIVNILDTDFYLNLNINKGFLEHYTIFIYDDVPICNVYLYESNGLVDFLGYKKSKNLFQIKSTKGNY